jgi:hypothetical protein
VSLLGLFRGRGARHDVEFADALILLVVGAFIYYSSIVSPYFLQGAFSDFALSDVPALQAAKDVAVNAWNSVW